MDRPNPKSQIGPTRVVMQNYEKVGDCHCNLSSFLPQLRGLLYINYSKAKGKCTTSYGIIQSQQPLRKKRREI